MIMGSIYYWDKEDQGKYTPVIEDATITLELCKEDPIPVPYFSLLPDTNGIALTLRWYNERETEEKTTYLHGEELNRVIAFLQRCEGYRSSMMELEQKINRLEKDKTYWRTAVEMCCKQSDDEIKVWLLAALKDWGWEKDPEEYVKKLLKRGHRDE